MDRPTPDSSSFLSMSELLSAGSDQRSLPAEALHSAVYSAVQAPLKGVAQIVDKTFSTNTLPAVEFMDAPKNAEFLSAKWHAQQLGNAAGMVAPFLALHKGVGKVSALALGKVETDMATQTLSRRVIGEAAVTGALYEGVFKPVNDLDGNFLAARAKNALVGGATFATLAASIGGIKNLAHAETGVTGKILRSDLGASVLAGIPAGLVSAEANSVLSGKGHATAGELAESAYSFAFAGGALSLGKSAIGSTRAEAVLREQMKQDSAAAIADGAPTLAERAALGIETAQAKLGALADSVTRPGLQPAFVGVESGGRAPILPEMNAVFMTTGRPLRGGLGSGTSGLIPADIVAGMKKGAGQAPPVESPAAAEANVGKAETSQTVPEVAKPEKGPSPEATVAEAKPAVPVKPADVTVAKNSDGKAAEVAIKPEAKPSSVPSQAETTGKLESSVVRASEAAPVTLKEPQSGKDVPAERPETKVERPAVAKPTSAKMALEKAHQAFDEASQSVRLEADRQQLRDRIDAAERKMDQLEKTDPPKLEGPDLAQWEAKQLRQFEEAQAEHERATDALRRSEARTGWVNPERPLRTVAEAVRTANEAVAMEPSAVKKLALAKEAGIALEKLLGRIPDGYKGAEGMPDLPRFSDLPPKSPGKLSPAQRLADLNKHLEAKVAELDAAVEARKVEVARQREAAKAAVLEGPVVKDLMQRAKDGRLHPHPEAIVVFMSGETAVQFQGAKGRQAGFSLAECADPAVLQARLAGQEITGAVVFTPSKVRLHNNRTVTQIKASRFYGKTPSGIGLPVLRDFLQDFGERR